MNKIKSQFEFEVQQSILKELLISTFESTNSRMTQHLVSGHIAEMVSDTRHYFQEKKNAN